MNKQSHRVANFFQVAESASLLRVYNDPEGRWVIRGISNSSDSMDLLMTAAASGYYNGKFVQVCDNLTGKVHYSSDTRVTK